MGGPEVDPKPKMQRSASGRSLTLYICKQARSRLRRRKLNERVMLTLETLCHNRSFEVYRSKERWWLVQSISRTIGVSRQSGIARNAHDDGA